MTNLNSKKQNPLVFYLWMLLYMLLALLLRVAAFLPLAALAADSLPAGLRAQTEYLQS